jgi:succinate dehydrogenase hydrophobic anchor subunit
METWEKILLGLMAVVLVVWFWPGLRHSLKHAPKGSSEDWRGLLLILLGVVIFVIFLLSTVR